jgi:ferredoxin
MNKVITFLLLLSVVSGAFFMTRSFVSVSEDFQFNPGWTIKEFAERNNIKPGTVKKQLQDRLELLRELSGSTRLSELNISEDQFRKIISHSKLGDLPKSFLLKIVIWALGLCLIFWYGLTVKNKKWIGKIRFIIMIAVFLGLGFFAGPSPNPMESTVQIVKYFAGSETKYQYAVPIFIVFVVFSVIGPKFFCSWACPLGALQESVFNIPFLKNRKLRPPFIWSIIVRGILFVIALLWLLVFADYFHGRSVYRVVNYFNIFNPSRLNSVALYTLPLFLMASFFIFRPFCHWICPFGFVSWVLEKFSVGRVRVKKNLCIDCKLCIKSCPTDAMSGILDGQKKAFQADCWSCGKCISKCPEEAIIFK